MENMEALGLTVEFMDHGDLHDLHDLHGSAQTSNAIISMISKRSMVALFSMSSTV